MFYLLRTALGKSDPVETNTIGFDHALSLVQRPSRQAWRSVTIRNISRLAGRSAADAYQIGWPTVLA